MTGATLLTPSPLGGAAVPLSAHAGSEVVEVSADLATSAEAGCWHRWDIREYAGN